MNARRLHACLFGLLVAGALAGCSSTDKTAANDPGHVPASRFADRSVNEEQAAITLRLLDEKLNSARLAASKVATMPAVSDPRARQEILLHATLYRASHDSRVARSSAHFVLDPVKEESPPDIGMNSEEFRLRVLGALDDLGVPVAWVTETWRSQGVDHFPGVGEPGPVATRLRISIFKRDENSGVVIGEVGDWTAGGGASKQGVTCRWDGLAWQIERDPVRMVW